MNATNLAIALVAAVALVAAITPWPGRSLSQGAPALPERPAEGAPARTPTMAQRPRTPGDPFWGYTPSPRDVTALLDEASAITVAANGLRLADLDAESARHATPTRQEKDL